MRPSEVASLPDSTIARMAAEIVKAVYSSGVSSFDGLYQDIAARLDSIAEILEEQEASQLTADEFIACQEMNIDDARAIH